MTIRAITQSGTEYIFTQNKDGEFHFMRGITTGKVTKMHRPIEVGTPLEFDFLREGVYGATETFPTYFRSTEVKKIAIFDLIPHE